MVGSGLKTCHTEDVTKNHGLEILAKCGPEDNGFLRIVLSVVVTVNPGTSTNFDPDVIDKD